MLWEVALDVGVVLTVRKYPEELEKKQRNEEAKKLTRVRSSIIGRPLRHHMLHFLMLLRRAELGAARAPPPLPRVRIASRPTRLGRVGRIDTNVQLLWFLERSKILELDETYLEDDQARRDQHH